VKNLGKSTENGQSPATGSFRFFISVVMLNVVLAVATVANLIAGGIIFFST